MTNQNKSPQGKWTISWKQDYTKLTTSVQSFLADLTGSLCYVPDFGIYRLLSLIEANIKTFTPTHKKRWQGYNINARIVQDKCIEVFDYAKQKVIAQIEFKED